MHLTSLLCSYSNTILLNSRTPVCVSSDATITSPAPVLAQEYVAPSAPAYPAVAAEPEINVNTTKKSPAERMGELDEMRGLLSEDEYQQKRAEILSDV